MIGDKRSYLTCLIMIDHDNVVKFAQDHNVPFTNYASLCRAPEVLELIGREVEAVNKKFARVETIKKFRLIDQLLTAEDEELTPTMKLKRSLVEKKYGELIKDMYAVGHDGVIRKREARQRESSATRRRVCSWTVCAALGGNDESRSGMTRLGGMTAR